MLTYKRPNRRKCYWLCPDCLKGRKDECSCRCPDYISIARAERIRRDAQIIREESSLSLHYSFCAVSGQVQRKMRPNVKCRSGRG